MRQLDGKQADNPTLTGLNNLLDRFRSANTRQPPMPEESIETTDCRPCTEEGVWQEEAVGNRIVPPQSF